MKSLKDLTVDLGRLQQKCDEAMKVAPAIIGNMVAQDIKANFMRQGVQTDQGLRKWKPSEAAQKEGRRTLVKSAAMMNEVHFEVQGKTVRAGLDTRLIPYAPRHNEGLKGMPQRQFIYVRKAVLRKAMDQVENMLKK
jgi:hypothetical protein